MTSDEPEQTNLVRPPQTSFSDAMKTVSLTLKQYKWNITAAAPKHELLCSKNHPPCRLCTIVFDYRAPLFCRGNK